MSDTARARRLIIIGDSISLGAAEVRGNEVVSVICPCYVDLLRQALPNVVIEVDADVNRTTIGVCDNIDRILAKKPDVALLLIGGNDADMDWRRFVLTEGKMARSRISVERFESNLRAIARRLLDAGARPVLTDMHNHHFEMRGPYISNLVGKDVAGWLAVNGGQAESDRFLERYRAIVADLANAMNIDLIRCGSALDEYDPREALSADGAHPGPLGHRVLFETMLPVLRKSLAAGRADLCP